MWLEFQSISTWLRGFFSGCSGFPPSAKSTHSLFHQAVLLCSEVIHGSCSGAERLAGSTAPSVRSRWAAPLAIQSPTARKGDQQVTYYYYYYYYYSKIFIHLSLSKTLLLLLWWSSNSLVQEKPATCQIFHAILEKDKKGGNRAIYMRENKPRLTLTAVFASYVSRGIFSLV